MAASGLHRECELWSINSCQRAWSRRPRRKRGALCPPRVHVAHGDDPAVVNARSRRNPSCCYVSAKCCCVRSRRRSCLVAQPPDPRRPLERTEHVVVHVVRLAPFAARRDGVGLAFLLARIALARLLESCRSSRRPGADQYRRPRRRRAPSSAPTARSLARRRRPGQRAAHPAISGALRFSSPGKLRAQTSAQRQEPIIAVTVTFSTHVASPDWK